MIGFVVEVEVHYYTRWFLGGTFPKGGYHRDVVNVEMH